MYVVQTVALMLILALVSWTAWYDVRHREIPDWVPLLVAAVALLLAAWSGWCESGMGRMVRTLVGAAVGFGCAAPWFYWGGLGGGDVKLFTALGAFLGPLGVLALAFWTAVGGGVLAVIAKWRGQSDYAYGPAIWIGLVITMARSEGLRLGG